jgi:hypothetical protein
MNALREQMTPGVFRVNEVEIANVVDQPPVDFLGYVSVETAISGFHVVYRDLHSLGHYCGDTAIRVAEHKHRVRPFFLEHGFACDENVPHHSPKRRRLHFEKTIGAANLQLLKEDLVQLIVIVLASMYDAMIDRCI